MDSSVVIALQVTVPSAITAAALLWQQHRTGRREDRRDEKAREDRAEDRKFALQERWRDDRKAAHAKLLASLATGVGAANLLRERFPSPGRDDALSQTYASEFETALSTARAEMGEVMVLGSRDARTYAIGALNGLTELGRSIYSLEDLEPRMARQQSLKDGFDIAYARYLSAVREELGTSSEA